MTEVFRLIKKIFDLIYLVLINLNHFIRVVVNNVFDFMVVIILLLLTSVLSQSILVSQKFEISSFINAAIAISGVLSGLILAYASVLEKEDPLKDYVIYGGEQCFRGTMFLLFSGIFSFADIMFDSQSNLHLIRADVDTNVIYWSRLIFKIISIIYVILAIFPSLTGILYLNSILNFKSSRKEFAEFVRIQQFKVLKFKWITFKDHEKYNALTGTEHEKYNSEVDRIEKKRISEYYGIEIPKEKIKKSEVLNPQPLESEV